MMKSISPSDGDQSKSTHSKANQDQSEQDIIN